VSVANVEKNVAEHAPRSAWRSRLVFLAKLCVAAGLLSWLLFSGQLELGRLASVRFSGELGVLMLLTLGSMALPALRWWWLLRIQQLHEPLGTVIALTWAGYFTALVLPGAASGDLAKSYLILRRRPQARARAFSTILADRFIGLHSLLCLGMFSVCWFAFGEETGMAIGGMEFGLSTVLLAMTLGCTLLFFPHSRKWIIRLMATPWRLAWNESFSLYREGSRQLLGCYCLSLVSGTLTIASFAVAGRLLGDSVSWDAALLAGPVVIVANCLPITPGGIGTAETVSSEAFARMGTSSGAEMMVLLRIGGALVSLPGALAILALKKSYWEHPISRESGA
jgi:uncharacterized membrane protein YbhN (UPF0104 family)